MPNERARARAAAAAAAAGSSTASVTSHDFAAGAEDLPRARDVGFARLVLRQFEMIGSRAAAAAGAAGASDARPAAPRGTRAA